MKKIFMATALMLFVALGVFSQTISRATATVRSTKTLISEVKTIFNKKGQPKKNNEAKKVVKPQSAQPEISTDCGCSFSLPIETQKPNVNHYHSVLEKDGKIVIVAVKAPGVRPRKARQSF
ncbi:MAG TPA: hypothetical protein PKY82_35210 [Pyrinomonadaceae bacterium]|nr:hypothetical protein [Pyrinomonadaceae bacterium]